jgi:hypothetical protein
MNDTNIDGVFETPSSPDDPIRLNKALALAALRAAGVCHATIAYEGHGDSGGIESVMLVDASQREVPEAAFHIMKAWCNTAEYVEGEWRHTFGLQTMSLEDALTLLTNDAINEHHDGYENGSGGGGELIIDVAGSTMMLLHREDYTESEYTETEL